MQFRRRWSPIALFAIVAAFQASSAFAAMDLKAEAAKLQKAKGQEAVDIANGVIDEQKKIPGPLDKDRFGAAVVAEFEPLIAGHNPDAALNAAIAIAKQHTASTDSALEKMLSNANPAIRYWGAKGVGEIPNLKAVGGEGAALRALNAQLPKETSGLVKKEIIRAIAKLDSITEMVKALDTLAAAMQTTTPDQETLEAASIGLTELDIAIKEAVSKGKPPAPAEILDIAKKVTLLLSFASQQEVALFNARTKDGGALPDGYHANVVAVTNNGIKVLNSLAGMSAFTGVPGDLDPNATLLLLNGVTGAAFGETPGSGQVQKTFPGVTTPPAIKPGK